MHWQTFFSIRIQTNAYLIINNEYKSMVSTILQECLPYSNECECTYGSYYGCMDAEMHFSLVEVHFCESRMYVSFNVQFQILMSHSP